MTRTTIGLTIAALGVVLAVAFIIAAGTRYELVRLPCITKCTPTGWTGRVCLAYSNGYPTSQEVAISLCSGQS
jgi:hypothetical protein